MPLVSVNDYQANQDVMESTADCLGDIDADEKDELNESDAEDRGTGTNLGRCVWNNFSTREATTRLMNWDAEYVWNCSVHLILERRDCKSYYLYQTSRTLSKVGAGY